MTLGMSPEQQKRCGEIEEYSDLEAVRQAKLKKDSAQIADIKG